MSDSALSPPPRTSLEPPAEQAAKSGPLKTIAIIGAGVMGCGLAEALITTGHKVILIDCVDSALSRALANIRKSLFSFILLADKGAEKPSAAMKRLQTSGDLAGAADAEFVIENIPESRELKADLYGRLGKICQPSVTVAANSSTIPTDELASLISHPERVIGMHFMNPAPTKRLVELIPGRRTSPHAMSAALQLLDQMGREAVIVGDAPGFVTNRVLMLTINEAIQIVQDGIASPEDVDRLFRGCFGHPMGPLATGDLIGLDTVLLSLESLKARSSESKFEPCSLLRKMVGAGELGRKSGSGFFNYSVGG